MNCVDVAGPNEGQETSILEVGTMDVLQRQCVDGIELQNRRH